MEANLKEYENFYKRFTWNKAKKEIHWFPNNKLNAAYNAVDKHVKTWRRNKVALYYEDETSSKKYTYQELSELSNKFANVLKNLKVKKGDRIFIFLPRIPELYVSFLGIIKTGAVGGTLFQAFGPQALEDRLGGSEASIVITDNELKKRIHKILYKLPNLKKLIIVNGTKLKKNEINYEEAMKQASNKFKVAQMHPNDLAFMLYTSGCCHKDTFIQLANGEIAKIESIYNNRQPKPIINLTQNPLKQEIDKVEKIYRYDSPDILYSIRTSSTSGVFTQNHPFFTVDQNCKIIQKEIKDLKKNDYIFSISKINFKGKKQKLPKIMFSESSNSGRFRPKNIPAIPRYLNPRLSQIFGYLTGDGNIDKRSLVFTDKDMYLLRHYKKLLKKELNVNSIIRTYQRQRLLVNSSLLTEYIGENFSEMVYKSNKRNIPKIIQKSEQSCVASFIRGIFDAEASVGPAYLKFTSTSEELIRVLQLLLKRFGVYSQYYDYIQPARKIRDHLIKETRAYDIYISNFESLFSFQKEIGFSSKKKIKKLKVLVNEVASKKHIEKERFPIFNLLKSLYQTVQISERESIALGLAKHKYFNRAGKNKLKEIMQFINLKSNEIKNLDVKIDRERLLYLFKIQKKEAKKIKDYYLARLKERRLTLLGDLFSTFEKLTKINAHLEKILSVDLIKTDSEFVYDLSVERNHTYLANGLVVHNSTGKPKGIIHRHYACLQEHLTAKWVLDLKEDDLLWCTADPGWVTGIVYQILGTLSNGVSEVIYNGRFNADNWYKIMEKYKVTVWYTAPTAIRMLMKEGSEVAKKYDLSSLRHLCSVGEPLNPEAIRWGHKVYGLWFYDNWWQTETGSMMVSNYRCMKIKIGSMGKPVPGVKAAIVDDNGNKVKVGKEGNLALRPGWPAMFQGVWKNEEKYKSYFKKGWYLSGDHARLDKDGYFWFIGRADDVIKTAGERVGPFEVESALLEHKAVAEAGVIGKPDKERGEIIKAFIVLKKNYKDSENLKNDISNFVKRHLAGHAYPREISFIKSLPKTKSGKIMRRVLKAQELGLPLGDTSTMEEY